MNIYLDTSHLQKWCNQTLIKEEINSLNNLKNSGNHKFVLSFLHIQEITDRADRDRALELAEFLDDLPKTWIRNPTELIHMEVKELLRNFRKHLPFHQAYFVDHFVDCLEPTCNPPYESHILEARLKYRGKKICDYCKDLYKENKQSETKFISQEELSNQIRGQRQYLECPSLSNGRKKIKEQFIKNLRNTIKKLEPNLNEKEIDRCISYTTENLHLIKNVLWQDYAVLYTLISEKNKKWKPSHVFDLAHLAALPYVDVLTLDNDACNIYNKTQRLINKTFNIKYKCTVYKKINI